MAVLLTSTPCSSCLGMTALFDWGLSLSGDANGLFGLVGFTGDLCMKVSIPDWIRLFTGFLCPAINNITVVFPHLMLVATCLTSVSTFCVHLRAVSTCHVKSKWQVLAFSLSSCLLLHFHCLNVSFAEFYFSIVFSSSLMVSFHHYVPNPPRLCWFSEHF